MPVWPIRSTSHARCAANRSGRGPPLGFGAALPVSRKRCDHFTTDATLTPNKHAVSRHERPDITDATTRSRKSVE